jgi:hypothetical protein
VLVALPYPRFAGAVTTPTTPGTGVRPEDQRWPATVQVVAGRQALRFVRRLDSPTLQSAVQQPPVRLRRSIEADPESELAVELRYGRELVLRTAGHPNSLLLVEPSP